MINLLKESENISEPILFCVVKNDILKLPKFFEHYRTLGIKSFIFLDNDSTDGTKEYLMDQSDVTLYHSEIKYSSTIRCLWIDRLLCKYGMNKWCVVVDSDEFIDYICSDNYSINDLIRHCDTDRIEGFHLDMYPKGQLFNSNIEECKYFDKEGYEIVDNLYGTVVLGGYRRRVFNLIISMSKYPIFYYSKNLFYKSSHYLYPYAHTPIWLAIRHYKFVDNKDYNKLEYAVKNEIYYNHSQHYKKVWNYVNENGIPQAYNDDISEEYINSESLRVLDFLDTPFELKGENV